MTISETMNKGRSYYVVDYKVAGKRKKKYCHSVESAEKEMAKLLKDKKKLNSAFLRYPEAVRVDWMLAHELADGAFSIMEAVRHCLDKNIFKAQTPIEDAVITFLADKFSSGITERSLNSLASTVNRFSEGHKGVMISDVSPRDVRNWLEGLEIATRTRNGYLTDLKNLFNWAEAEKLVRDNPCESLKKYRASEEEMVEIEGRKTILTVEETRKMMSIAVARYPQLVPRLAILLFAGLRPEREAAGQLWENIHMSERLVHVLKSKAKDRQERYIRMTDCLFNWLSWSKKRGHELPISNWRKQFDKLRSEAGLMDEWPRDATRHTFASYHLVKHGAESTKDALGHGTYDMLFMNYRTLVKPKEADEYFCIAPE